MKKYFFTSITLLILTNCSIFKSKPILTNAHKGKYQVNFLKADDVAKIINANVSAIPLQKSKAQEKEKTFFDLRDSIPHKFLEVLGKEATSAKELIEYIKEPLSKKEESKPKKLQTDFTTFQLRLTFNNFKKYAAIFDGCEDQTDNCKDLVKKYSSLLHPNTRLDYLVTTFKFPNDYKNSIPFRIVGIDRIENEFESINLGELLRENTTTFNSKLSANYGISAQSSQKDSISPNNLSSNSRVLNKGVSGELSSGSTDILKEALNQKQKRLKTGFSFKENEITLMQRGSLLSDIVDNEIVTVNMKFTKHLETDKPVFNFTGMTNAKGIINDASELNVSKRVIQYVPCSKISNTSAPIKFTNNISGLIRSVRNLQRGDNAYEFDDKVIYYSFKKDDNQNPISINHWNICKRVYKIYAEINNKKYYLHVEDSKSGIKYSSINLLDNEKEAFILWLQKLINAKDSKKLKSTHLNIYLKRTGGNSPKISIIGSNPNISFMKQNKIEIKFEDTN